MKKAFTLIETIVYISIVGVIIVAASTLAINVFQSYEKNSNYQNIQNNSRFILNRITDEIESAEAINLADSIFDQDNGKLSLQTNSAQTNPTIFQIESGILTIKQGTAESIPLTNTDITISQLNFQNLSAPKTSGTIKITITLNYLNLGNRADQNASLTLTSSANLHKN